MVGKTALNKERYHLNGGPFQTLFISRIYISTTLCQMCQLCQIPQGPSSGISMIAGPRSYKRRPAFLQMPGGVAGL